MSYMSVDAIAEKVVAWGKSTLLAKMDIKQAIEWCQCTRRIADC